MDEIDEKIVRNYSNDYYGKLFFKDDGKLFVEYLNGAVVDGKKELEFKPEKFYLIDSPDTHIIVKHNSDGYYGELRNGPDGKTFILFLNYYEVQGRQMLVFNMSHHYSVVKSHNSDIKKVNQTIVRNYSNKYYGKLSKKGDKIFVKYLNGHLDEGKPTVEYNPNEFYVIDSPPNTRNTIVKHYDGYLGDTIVMHKKERYYGKIINGRDGKKFVYFLNDYKVQNSPMLEFMPQQYDVVKSPDPNNDPNIKGGKSRRRKLRKSRKRTTSRRKL